MTSVGYLRVATDIEIRKRLSKLALQPFQETRGRSGGISCRSVNAPEDTRRVFPCARYRPDGGGGGPEGSDAARDVHRRLSTGTRASCLARPAGGPGGSATVPAVFVSVRRSYLQRHILPPQSGEAACFQTAEAAPYSGRRDRFERGSSGQRLVSPQQKVCHGGASAIAQVVETAQEIVCDDRLAWNRIRGQAGAALTEQKRGG